MADNKRTVGLKAKQNFWKQHYDQWLETDLSQAEYCRQNNLNRHRWGYWRKRFVKTESTTEFVPLPLNQSIGFLSPSPITLIIKDTYKIEIDRGFDPTTLKLLLSVLQ